MSCSLRDSSKKIIENSYGASAVEFALVVPLFLILIFCAFEYCIMDFASVQIDAALALTARQGQTGEQTFSSPSPNALKTLLISNLFPSSLFTPANLSITVESFANYSDIGTLEPCAAGHAEPCSSPGQFIDVNGDGVRDLIGGSGGSGSGGQIAVYVANYTWNGITPFWKLIETVVGGSNGHSITLSSSVLTQNEPFPVSR